ncbi:hypothetical protein RB195_001516 [Necator americanus]|uniref:DUF7622 domain-containing protein n=1 Tax=Necator americanus TaxID=51031 RepID=A0ABR1DEV8_NECAM
MPSLVRLLLTLFVVKDAVIALIRCKKCDYNFEADQEMCNQDCLGTLCFYLEYYYTQPERLFTRKGCISGAAPSTGCRRNQDGQVLCLCDTEHCNRDQLLLLTGTPPVQLPLQVCKRELVNGLEPSSRWTKPCAGNFCIYKKSKFALENGTKGYAHSMDCSTSSDFDLFYSQVPFSIYPESCAKLEYGGQPDETICYGSMSDASAAVFSQEALVECHADFLSRHLPYIPVRKLCKGQFCVIAASHQGDVYRGCLTLDQEKTERKIAPGYYQSYNGIEQWICAASSCNYNLQKMEESWPEELATFKNITRLQIDSLFEELNTASDISRPLIFAIFHLLITYIIMRVIKILQRYSKPMQLAFMEFEAAFDSLHQDRLLNALRADGVQGRYPVTDLDYPADVVTIAEIRTKLQPCIAAFCPYALIDLGNIIYDNEEA